ncbi:hypothetical protein QBC32DRAFT_391053, partial [Pseudoneurospora amorphoporcata]
PNYEKSTVEVFSDFTTWWISHHGKLDTLLSAVHAQPSRTWRLCHRMEREADYAEKPSWSFWYEGRSEWSLGTLGLFNNRGFGFCASGDTEADMDLESLRPTPPGTLASFERLSRRIYQAQDILSLSQSILQGAQTIRKFEADAGRLPGRL